MSHGFKGQGFGSETAFGHQALSLIAWKKLVVYHAETRIRNTKHDAKVRLTNCIRVGVCLLAEEAFRVREVEGHCERLAAPQRLVLCPDSGSVRMALS